MSAFDTQHLNPPIFDQLLRFARHGPPRFATYFDEAGFGLSNRFDHERPLPQERIGVGGMRLRSENKLGEWDEERNQNNRGDRKYRPGHPGQWCKRRRDGRAESAESQAQEEKVRDRRNNLKDNKNNSGDQPRMGMCVHRITFARPRGQ
jgi:hypothetical protein